MIWVHTKEHQRCQQQELVEAQNRAFFLSSEETKASTLTLAISPGMGEDEFLLLNCLVLGALLCYS